ncbi:hypothetical protein LAZ67_X000593 [Cordylochernes scorpioides]|uniref:RNA-directed DNA polymerase n=1 Tax=Cordylochernes scorpioides TaxID=51811 RepID=A0ABY6LRX8_9ARAC|nr:hypothetical protein LAZ67_X000593 [Cordylochernes scorpioides]
MYQLDAPLSPLTYHFAVLPERCTYWECQADLCKAHTIFPPSANNTQYAHFSDNTSTTQGLTQPPHHVQSKNFFRANCSYYRVKVPEQPPNANLSHPTKVQTDHLHHTPKHPHSTHHSMYHTHHPSSPEHLPGIPIDNQPQPPYPPQFPALLRQYQHVFSRNKFAVPCLKVPPVRIATNSDKVVTIRPYRVPICDQREIRSQIRQMLDNDIIEPSYSPFSSPVTLVTKRDKTKRFCIDYRKVNEVISSDVHPLPRIEDILDRLARAKYFSTADVSSAYWQVPIHPDSRPLLAFATIDGLYQPTRLPFGLKTSPQIYERAINQVLQGHGLDCVAHYFDDFVIYSETLEEHQEHLRKFFAFCDAENLQLNLTKCEFFRQTIEFLGYTITAGTTTPLIRNTDVIHAIPPPNNRKTLQSFLGAVNVYNKFIPDYARLRTPLNNLLKKDVTWDWDDKRQKAFTSLKESLTQHPVLHLYKDELPCQVYCDASTLGIAGVLKQVHSAGKAYPVQYFSRALRVHERNYTISELECLAIVESVEKFRVYLMGRKFTIFSDHHALQWLKTIKNPSGRLFRWSLRLSCYEYEVRYIKGAQQHEADLLSRNPFCGFLDATLIKNHQLTPSGESKLTIDRNGLQTLKRRGVTKIVVPDALVPDLLTKVHSRYNHPGISQMTRLISPQYYWKGMSEDISKTTKACAICQSTKPPRGPTFGELGQLPVATQPFDLVALDTIAGLAKYGNAKAYLHVVVDHFSRYTWTFPSKSTSITTYQQVIKRVLQDGSPKRLLTDRAPAFTSPKFRKFLINRNIHPLLTTSNNPQANGLCERLNATLTGKLRLLHLENPKAAWTKLAKRVTVVYNNTPHSVTGFPPGYLMFGVLPPELTEHVNPYPVLTTARRIAHERTQAKHLKDKHAYDQQHKTPHFEPGDLVLVKVYHHPNTGKLAPYFTGPYEILEIISPNVVRINRPNQPLNRNTDTVHVNKLQYYNENIRYIAPPTLIPHPAKPQSRTLPPLFEHLTPDLFTVERFAPTIGNCTTTTPVDPQCNIIAQRDIPQPAISRPTHITKVKTPIPTVRADPKPIPLQARFFHNVKTFPLFHLLYLINLFILPTVLLPMATLLYVSVYTLQPNRLFQLQEALFEITIAVVELIHRTIGIILPELWTILVHSHALVALIELNVLRDWDVRQSSFPTKFTIMADRDRDQSKGIDYQRMDRLHPEKNSDEATGKESGHQGPLKLPLDPETMNAELKKLRTPVRARFTKAFNELETEIKKKEVKKADVEKILRRFQIHHEKLSILNMRMEEALLRESASEDIFTAEYESVCEYEDNFSNIMTDYEALADAEKDDVSTISGTAAMNYRLPKLEFKKFGGEPREWITFWSQFSTIDRDPQMPPETKFQYLFQATAENSEVREAVESFPPSADNYPKVIEYIKSRLGEDEMLVEIYVRDLLQNVRAEGKMSVVKLYDRLETQLRALETLGVARDKFAAMLYPLVESALPEDTLRVWERSQYTVRGRGVQDKLTQLMTCLKTEVKGESRVNMAKAAFNIDNNQDAKDDRSNRKSLSKKNTGSKMPTATDLANTTQMRNNCIFCGNGHPSQECYSGQRMPLPEKKDKAKGKNRSYISKRMVDALGLKRVQQVTLTHNLFGGGEIRQKKHNVYKVNVSSLNNEYMDDLKFLDQEVICGHISQVQDHTILNELKARGINLTDICQGEEISIHMLIGSDLLSSILTGRMQILQNGVVATETKLGWTVMGPAIGKDMEDSCLIVTSLHVNSFVSNRVKEITALTKSEDLNHVAGEHNPADLPSRGESPSKVTKSGWWEGPKWLQEKKEDWPVSKVQYDLEVIEEERRKTVVAGFVAKKPEENPWYLNLYKGKREPSEYKGDIISQEELDSAEKSLVKIIQSESIEIIVKSVHEKMYHCGAQTLRSVLREKFWIPKARQLVRHVIHKCPRCRRFETKRVDVPEASLPQHRVRDVVVFEVTGIDLGGPLYLEDGRKVWFVIFTCGIYRAVHLELVTSLSTEALVGAVERFVARRGCPAVIYSDNGTNLVGLWNELYRVCFGVKWKLNPPAAPWWGGWIERIVGLTKKLLRRLLVLGQIFHQTDPTKIWKSHNNDRRCSKGQGRGGRSPGRVSQDLPGEDTALDVYPKICQRRTQPWTQARCKQNQRKTRNRGDIQFEMIPMPLKFTHSVNGKLVDNGEAASTRKKRSSSILC